MNKLNKTLETYEKDVERYTQKLEFPLPKKELDYFINLLKGKKILDAGCGAGRDSKYLFDKGLDVIGIDMSKNMIIAAKNRADADFEVMDIRKTSFPSKFFDGIWCYNALLHLNKHDLQMTIDEFKRILKNKGILFIATRHGEGEIAKKSVKGTKYFFLYQEDYLKSILERIGFEIILIKKYRQKGEDFIDIILKR